MIMIGAVGLGSILSVAYAEINGIHERVNSIKVLRRADGFAVALVLVSILTGP